MSVATRTLNGQRIKPTLELNEPPPSSHEFVVSRGTGACLRREARAPRRDSLTRLNLPNETGAVLMGRTFTDGRHAFTVVTDLIPPRYGEVIGSVATVEITAEGRRRMEIEGRLRDPLARAIGWMHSHPVQQAFFSATDVAEQGKWASPPAWSRVLGRTDADPRWRVFVGPTASEALVQPPVVGMDRPPQGMHPHAAEAVPEPLTERRNAILDVASEAERPELGLAQPSHSSPADARPARYAETRPGRTLSRVSGGPAGRRARPRHRREPRDEAVPPPRRLAARWRESRSRNRHRACGVDRGRGHHRRAAELRRGQGADIHWYDDCAIPRQRPAVQRPRPCLRGETP